MKKYFRMFREWFLKQNESLQLHIIAGGTIALLILMLALFVATR